MKKLKKWIRLYGGKTLQSFIIWLLRITRSQNKYILFSTVKAKKNQVNINYWSETKNLGDAICPMIVSFGAKQLGVDISKRVNGTKHLYAVGSVITAGSQDCTIWGSGILNLEKLPRVRKRKLDIRAVRGPLTRLALLEYGYKVPEVYGDPGILMPMIYNPETQKQYPVSVITHMDENITTGTDINRIQIQTEDYEAFVRQIKASERIISSSLHGIIFAEAYGVPAILLRPKNDLFKYYDYYYSTKRFDFPIADSIEEALTMNAPEIPDLTAMQKGLLSAFPADLWQDKK